MRAPSGSVVTQAVRMPSTVLRSRLPVTAPMPKMPPVATWVVETGRPNREATDHQPGGGEVGDEALAGVERGDLVRHGLGDPPRADEPADRHGDADDRKPDVGAERFGADRMPTIWACR